jgi:ABC-2 type transport system permease protein
MNTPTDTPMSAGAGTFAPAPGAAPLPRQVLAQARMETRLLLRNGEQLLLAVVIPLIVLVGGVLAAKRTNLHLPHGAVDTLTPGVLALAVMSTSFTSLAIATGFERRYGVLKRGGGGGGPPPGGRARRGGRGRSGLLAGKVGSLLVVEVLQVVLISVVGLLLGWGPDLTPAGVAGAVACVLLGTAAFASLGLLLAGALRAEATLAAANLVYLLLLAGGAVVLPTHSYGAFGAVLRYLPSGALGTGMRTALIHGAFPTADLLVLVAWAAVGTLLTSRTFKWE